MPTRRNDAQSTIDADTPAASATAPARTHRKKRSSAAGTRTSASAPAKKTVRRASAETEPKPIRRRVTSAVTAGGDQPPGTTAGAEASVIGAAAGVDVRLDDVSAIDPGLDVEDAVVDDGDDVPVDIDAVDQDMLEPEDGSAEVDDVEDIDAATTADDVDAEVVDETDVVEDLVEEEEEVKPAVEPVPLTGVRAVGRPRSRADEAETLKLWKAYKAGATQQLRNRLIERYMHIVNFSAERMHARLPGEVDVDDLKQAGLFGLMDSIDAFDLSRGVKFETFCTARVRGAIFDELRAMDWVPRLVRARTSKVDRARKQLEVELGRKPTDEELCRQLGVDQSEFKKIIKDSSPVSTVSLDRKWFETDSSKDVREIDVIKDSKQESPLLQLQRGDLKHLITKGLSRAERLIVVLYYYEGMTMKEIGTTLDLSESRVSQMHSSILARLKAQMQHRDKEF